MSIYLLYGCFFFILLALELCYFKIADKYNIIDKPNERSSHSTIVLRGGGIIFLFGLWLWAIAGFLSLPVEVSFPTIGDIYGLLMAVTLVAGVSFIDDIRSLPESVRLIAQFASMIFIFYQLDVLCFDIWWIVILSLIVLVGASNIINFMDGINGITGAYSMALLIPLYLLNQKFDFVGNSLLIVVTLADVVFCIFNFRPKGKARCFAGDVGSMSVAYILLFLICSLILKTGDVTYLILLLVYGVDGCLTICHRIMLHEHLGEAHRKHAYQLLTNELKIGHIKVSLLYMGLQLVVSLGFIYLCPNTIACHWMFLVGTVVVLSVVYLLFMKKYYYLHEEYLASINKF